MSENLHAEFLALFLEQPGDPGAVKFLVIQDINLLYLQYFVRKLGAQRPLDEVVRTDSAKRRLVFDRLVDIRLAAGVSRNQFGQPRPGTGGRDLQKAGLI